MSQINLDYINLFIDHIKLIPNDSGNEIDIDMSSMFVGDISDIMEEFPQAVVYSDNGVVTFISKNMIESINESFESHKCLQCGHIQNDANVDSVTSFL